MRAKKLNFTFSVRVFNEDLEGEIEGTYTPGSPAVMYQRNGDPGWPADPSEFEVSEVRISDFMGQKFAPPIILDAKGQEEFVDRHQKQIKEWADETAADWYDGPDDDDRPSWRPDPMVAMMEAKRMKS